MSTPIEVERIFTTVAANEMVAVGFPGRANLQKLAVVRVGGGSIVVNVFNRNFTSEVYSGRIQEPVNYDLSGTRYVAPSADESMFVSEQPLLVRIGDTLRLTAADTPYDNVLATVRDISPDQKSVVLDSPPPVGPRVLATAQLEVTVADQPLAQVIPEQAGDGSLLFFPESTGGRIVFHNRDVENPSYNIGTVRKIYLQFAEAGTYKVAIGGTGVVQ